MALFNNFADTDFFPNIRKLLILRPTSPIGSENLKNHMEAQWVIGGKVI